MKKNGFTLTELLVSLVIFSFMAVTLSTVYATANRFFFQQYREDMWKNRLTLSMKFIKNKLSAATEIERPALGAQTNDLAFYTNFIKSPPGDTTYPGNGCAPTTAVSSQWHYFCVNSNVLYYYTGTLAGVTQCPNEVGVANWIGTISCGVTGGGVVLSQNITIPANRTTYFGRVNTPSNTVRVSLRMLWQATGGFSTIARNIDTSDETYVTINRPAAW